MTKHIEEIKTDDLMREHCELWNELTHLGICPTKINRLCELERELTLREEAI